VLYEASGRQTIAEAMSSSATDFRFVTPWDINDGGAVALSTLAYAEGLPGSEKASIIRWFDGASTTVLETTEGFANPDSIRLNEHGEVAFHGWKQNVEGAYYRTNGTTLSRIADSTGPLDIPSGSSTEVLAINDHGTVAFWSPLDAGGNGIFVGDGGPLTTVVIADPTTPFYSVHNRLDMNNQGTVAFFAELWDGRNGIFTGPDPVNDKVVAHGDLLFGQFVTGLGRPHLKRARRHRFLVRGPRSTRARRLSVRRRPGREGRNTTGRLQQRRHRRRRRLRHVAQRRGCRCHAGELQPLARPLRRNVWQRLGCHCACHCS
jgi:hypothetical protein